MLYPDAHLHRQSDTELNHTLCVNIIRRDIRTLLELAISLPKPSIHASPGEKLRYYRELKQLNQEEISRILGHESIWYIVNLEKGFNPIFYEDAVKLAPVLDIDPDDLLTEYTRFCKPGYGERIKRIRYEYHMSQGEFADLVETKRANVGIWECEYKNIHPEYGRFLHLKMLAEQKGLDFNKLIQDSEYCVDEYKRFIQADVPKKIRNIRAACGCFMGDFGRLMGFDNAASAISQWEAGNTKPSRKYFYKLRELAVSVGIDMDKLNEDPDFYKDEYAEFIETDCGDKIRYIRLQYGVFMEQFAEMIGTSGNTISEWEAGNCVPMRYWFPEIKKAAANKGIDLNALNGHPEIYKDPFTELIQKQDSEEWVRRIRKQCGLTVDAFARYIGVSRSTVNSWETHQNCRKPSRESFNRIVEMAKMRGVDIYDPWRAETMADQTASE